MRLLPVSGLVVVLSVVFGAQFIPARALAQGTFPGAEEMGNAIADMTRRGWFGPRVEKPEGASRPPEAPLACSLDGEINVHGGDEFAAVAQDLLPELEAFARYLRAGGFYEPLNDGGRGGSDGFDLYLQATPDIRSAQTDGMSEWSFFDRATAFATLDPVTAGEDIRTCAVEAYARASMLSLLPEEGPRWHNAFASWLTWRWTGRFGCASAMSELQEFPERAWFDADDGAGGGVLLAILSERHGAGQGAFVRDWLEVARQRTWDGEGLRGSPDLWQAFSVILDAAGELMSTVAEKAAWDRYFIGHGHDPSLLSGLAAPEDVRIDDAIVAEISSLPFHSPGGIEVNPYGSAYARVDVRGAPPQARLRVWLRGEYGVEWALSATRLNGEGNEQGRLSAPPRRADGRSYLPVELSPDTEFVVVAVTNLSHRLPDEDEDHPEDPNARSFRLIFDIATD
ncbi:MAG: hypothetical protein AB8H86_13550 [Polyangiales bacterium]